MHLSRRSSLLAAFVALTLGLLLVAAGGAHADDRPFCIDVLGERIYCTP